MLQTEAYFNRLTVEYIFTTHIQSTTKFVTRIQGEMLMEKIEKAAIACENVLEGIENNTISTASALLQCLKIARLLGDQDAIIWLQYEYGGYPKTETGHIEHSAWQIAYGNGRGYKKEGKDHIFTELASELEEMIQTQHQAINNFSTQGASVSGEWAATAMNNLTQRVVQSTGQLISSISQSEKRLSILKSRYYDYALKKQIEISFGNVASNVFSAYRAKVENHFSSLSKTVLLKLQALEGKIDSDNPELYSQALTTCRRLFQDVADELFKKHLSTQEGKMFKTKAGKEIDISGDHYKNRLSAVIETLEGKTPGKSIIGSNVIYLLDWIDNLCNLQSKGVHADISKQDAMRCIIQTYVCLGDVLNLQKD